MTRSPMPKKIRPENRFTGLLKKVEEYIQAVEQDEDSAYHLRYLKSLKKQLDKKMEEGELSSELQSIYETLEAFIPYHSRENTQNNNY